MAVEYARTMKPDVVNMSLGSYAVIDSQFVNANALGPTGCPGGPTVVFPTSKSQTFNDFQTMLTSEMHELQQDLLLDGTLAVIAAGNCSLDHDNTSLMIDYPGSMTGSNVVIVGSVGAASHSNVDALSSFSDFGTSTIDVAAPGEFFVVESINAAGQYAGAVNAFPTCELATPPPNDAGCHGTSFAAPMVTGAAALLLAADTSLTKKPCEIADRLLRNADAIGQLGTSIAGGRRLNVANAIANSQTNSVRSCP